VAHERARIRVARGHDPEEVEDLALEERRGVVEGGQGGERGGLRAEPLHRLHEPVLGRVREQVVHLEAARVGAAIVAHHQPQLGPVLRAQGQREAPGVARLDAAVQLARAHHAGLVKPALEAAREGARDRVQVLHRVVISTMRSSRVSTGAGSTSPSQTSASAHAARGTSAQRPVSPVATPSGGAP